jgi:hypothetical protein
MHLKEEMEVVGDLRGREGAPERGLEVPDGCGSGERYGGGPAVEGSDLELPLLLRHWESTGAASPPRFVRERGVPGRRVLARAWRRAMAAFAVCLCCSSVSLSGRELPRPRISGHAMGFRRLLYVNARQGGPSEKTPRPVSGPKESPWGPLSCEILLEHKKSCSLSIPNQMSYRLQKNII